MSHHKHLTISEREKILFFTAKGYSITQIAQELKRNKSTISRELRRNSSSNEYLPSKAQSKYLKRRKKCRPRLKLTNQNLFTLVQSLFLEHQWSPEQIAGRLKLEQNLQISYNTIYRAIYAGMFNSPHSNKEAARKLRHKGKSRHTKSYNERRGQIPISNHLSERPKEAQLRCRIGDWEVDTVIGQKGKSCLFTSTDRKSRFLVAGRVKKKTAEEIAKIMIELLKDRPLQSITPDRGKEFANHAEVTEALGVQFYFPPPHQPWQRGTNENTNGLLREYFPKSFDISDLSDKYIQSKIDEINRRPRKCLGYLTPYEVYFEKSLHLT